MTNPEPKNINANHRHYEAEQNASQKANRENRNQKT
jgi:hypothetical protein